MSAVVSVWSKVLIPEQDTLITEDVSIQITQITLEVDESKPLSEKRSVVKLQHLEAAPELLRAAAGYGYDSDSEMESDDEEIDSDELPDDDEEDEVDASMAVADTSKASKSSKKANGMSSTEAVAAGEMAEEDDDEDEESDDISFDSDFDREEAEVQLASLLPGRIEQIQTNVILPAGEDFVLKLSGPYKVHLFGHYIVQPVPPQFDQPPYGYDSDDITDSDDDSEDELSESEMGVFDPATGGMIEYDDSDDEDDNEDDDSERFEEIESRPKKAAKDLPKDKAAARAAVPAPAPLKKAESNVAPTTSASTAATEVDKSKLSKNQLKKLAKKEKDAAATAATPITEKPAAATASAAKTESKKAAEPAAPSAKPAEAAKKAPSKKQTLPSGVVIEDVKAGDGAAAKSGQRVQMRYIGRLQSGKIFDQNTKGEPFAFKLGKGEVIKGWDVGIAGMQVGGERRLTIPAAMAYGKQSIAGIPANSTLIFEVKLLAVK